MRHQILQQAARLLAEGIEIDYFSAKTKAAKSLGYGSEQDLPSNLEIENELKNYLSIFYADTHPHILESKRLEALAAMRCFADFDPRLVGSVLEATASKNSPIEIKLFVDSQEEVLVFLMERQIPFEQGERQVRVNRHETKQVPAIYFSANGHDIELMLFAHKEIRRRHISPVTGMVENRASIRHVEKLIKS